ncbi:GMC family oxidoreductase [Sphingopyxis flava]|uniref:Choline dehydrogenase n=1 Tax=Sphingopyxis flava TaxID=1507287 RepID=A0A1T5FYA3_9SPHN|nr:GMC family oxidoreductase N-terminal domain-containing protein [Sphingopyxis flava]SKC01132.1 Choline dehydrogenase [Sphingopyxis flava]
MTDFDYIIVGAGSAGCVLANSLSADPGCNVLLVEEGGSGDSFIVNMPKGFGKTLADPTTAHFFPTVRTREGGAGQEVWVRGKMLGGSSGVNGMVWNRGVAADYDRLAELAGDQWSWEHMRPLFLSLEDHASGASPDRGVGGPIPIKSHPAPPPLLSAWIEAGREMGLPVKQDHSDPRQEGIAPLQWNIDAKGRRVSAAKAFLKPALSRPNLKVETGIRTDRVVIENRRAVGVAGVHGDGTPVEFRCRGEVILSAGALGSPRILQLSGIGGAQDLQRAGIDVELDCPGVGHHMREHTLVMMNFRLRHNRDSDNSQFTGARLLANVAKHVAGLKNTMSYGSSEAAAFVKVLPESERPDSQLMFAPYSLDVAAGMAMEKEPGMQVYTMTLRPRSEGHVLVTGKDPAAKLNIDPNFLTDEYDRRAAIEQFRFVREMMAKAPLEPFIVGETDFTAQAQSDEEIIDLFHRFGGAGYHATATVRMGKENTAPLDGRLRLRGIDGLRVVDCSVFPEMIAGNTNAPTMGMALRAAELICEDQRSGSARAA